MATPYFLVIQAWHILRQSVNNIPAATNPDFSDIVQNKFATSNIAVANIAVDVSKV